MHRNASGVLRKSGPDRRSRSRQRRAAGVPRTSQRCAAVIYDHGERSESDGAIIRLFIAVFLNHFHYVALKIALMIFAPKRLSFYFLTFKIC